MQPASPSPFRGLRSAALLALAFYFFWKPFIVVVGVVALYLLAHRFMNWLGVSGKETLEALAAGLPFALILLIAFQLK